MKNKKTRKYTYDEYDGVFVLEDEINVNWLLCQVLKQEKLQISKISNDEVQKFLLILSESDLRMPDGQYCLFWLKNQLKEKKEMAEAKPGETWAKISSRFRYIIEQIDQVLICTPDLKEKMINKKEEVKKKSFSPNNMQAHFEPLQTDN